MYTLIITHIHKISSNNYIFPFDIVAAKINGWKKPLNTKFHFSYAYGNCENNLSLFLFMQCCVGCGLREMGMFFIGVDCCAGVNDHCNYVLRKKWNIPLKEWRLWNKTKKQAKDKRTRKMGNFLPKWMGGRVIEELRNGIFPLIINIVQDILRIQFDYHFSELNENAG